MGTPSTLIIGGGIAGLACARRLRDAGHPFLLVTDRLGGRMHAAATAPFGATYLTSDYRHVGRYVGRGPRIHKRDAYFRDGDRLITLFDPANLIRLPTILRFFAQVRDYRRHLNRLRQRTPFECQAESLRQNPFLTRCVCQSAAEFIRENALQDGHAVFAGPIVHSTMFTAPETLNTFHYLFCLFPILLATYLADFTGTLAKLTAGFEGSIVRSRVVALDLGRSDGFRMTLENGVEYRPRNVVVATPGHNTRSFCPELDRAAEDGVREVPICTLHVAGRRRLDYRPGKMVFLRPGEPATVLLPLPDGIHDLLFSHSHEPDLSAYYHHWQVVRKTCWKTALVLSGPAWRPLAPRPNVYTIGDHNICGLEDSFLTGLHAANRILEQSR